MSKIFRIIFICSLIIYSSCDDACANHKKADCASDTTNNCEWKTTTAEGCASSCVTKTTKDTCTTASCTWTKETGTCADKTFDCSAVGENDCGASGKASEGFCKWNTTGNSCDAIALECSDKDVDACTTASDTCTWTKTKDGSCGISGGTDACTTKTTQDACSGESSCSWIEEVGTCSTKTTTPNGGDNNDKNSCGFLKMSLSIFILVLFL